MWSGVIVFLVLVVLGVQANLVVSDLIIKI